MYFWVWKIVGEKIEWKGFKVKNCCVSFSFGEILTTLYTQKENFSEKLLFLYVFMCFLVLLHDPLYPKSSWKSSLPKTYKIMRYLVLLQNVSSPYTPKPFLVKSSLLIFALVYVFLLKTDEFWTKFWKFILNRTNFEKSWENFKPLIPKTFLKSLYFN